MFRSALRLLGGVDADAEDAVHESWRRILERLDRFEFRSAFRTWAIGITVRCCLEQMRKSHRFDVTAAEPPAPDRTSSSTPNRIDLERALEAMPPGFRTVVILHDLEGYTHADIGGMLGVSEGTSKSQLSRGRRWLREWLGTAYTRG